MTTDPWWAPANQTRASLTPQQVNRHRARTAVRAALGAAVVVAAGALVISGTSTPATTSAGLPGLVQHRQSDNALMGLCGAVYERDTPDTGVAIERERRDGSANRARYATTVPFSGDYYAPTGKPSKRFYGPKDTDIPTAEDLLGYQRTGLTIAWYTADAEDKDIAALRELAHGTDVNLIVAPWEAMQRGPLPQQRKIAYAVHGASQTCHRLSAPALKALGDTYGY